MMTLLTMAGFLIAVVVFLNLLTASESTKKANQSVYSRSNPPRLDNGKVLRQTEESGPRPRICPVCGTMLSQEDYLIAAMEPDPGAGKKRRAQIYGCPFCYTTGGVNLHQNKELEMEKIEP